MSYEHAPMINPPQPKGRAWAPIPPALIEHARAVLAESPDMTLAELSGRLGIVSLDRARQVLDATKTP